MAHAHTALLLRIRVIGARAAGRYAAPPMFARPVIFYLMEILTTKPVRGPVVYYLFEILRPVRDRASSVTTVEYELLHVTKFSTYLGTAAKSHQRSIPR